MHRRHALQHLLRGFAAGSLLGSTALYAQQGGPQAAAAPNAGGLGQRPQMVFQQLDPIVKQLLDLWELRTRKIERLHGVFDRYVYDSTFLEEKRAVGEFWYEAPDLGRIDFNPSPNLPPANDKGLRLNAKKTGANGQPYSVKADLPSRWVCRGDALLLFDLEQKSYDALINPPHMQGQNISNSPLPFLFGMPSAEMDKRYYLSLGPMHDPNGKSGRSPIIHVVAYPKLAAAAKDWSRAEVLLDPGTRFKDSDGQGVFVPTAIKLLDPSGQQETVYVFKLDQTKLNERLFFGNPFKDPGILSGFRCISTRTVEFEEPAQRAVQLTPPAGQNSEIR